MREVGAAQSPGFGVVSQVRDVGLSWAEGARLLSAVSASPILALPASSPALGSPGPRLRCGTRTASEACSAAGVCRYWARTAGARPPGPEARGFRAPWAAGRGCLEWKAQQPSCACGPCPRRPRRRPLPPRARAPRQPQLLRLKKQPEKPKTCPRSRGQVPPSWVRPGRGLGLTGTHSCRAQLETGTRSGGPLPARAFPVLPQVP